MVYVKVSWGKSICEKISRLGGMITNLLVNQGSFHCQTANFSQSKNILVQLSLGATLR